MVASIAFGQVLVSTDICIVRECVYFHSTVVGYGSQIKTPLVYKLLNCSCTLVFRMFGPSVIARGSTNVINVVYMVDVAGFYYE